MTEMVVKKHGFGFKLMVSKYYSRTQRNKVYALSFLSSDIQVTVAHVIYHFITVNTAYVSIHIYVTLPQYLFIYWRPSAV